MRILFVGYLNEGQTSRMRMEVLRDLGHEVYPLNVQGAWATASWLSRHVQQRLELGPVISAFNARLQEVANTFHPELLWAEKQEHVRASTLASLRLSGVRLLHYTPDPYFSLSWKRTRTMDKAMGMFDYLVTSKRYELKAYESLGKQVVYVPLGFDEKSHRPLSPGNSTAAERFSSDISFLGGWEPRREKLLTAIAGLGGRLKIWGQAWSHLIDGAWGIRRAYRLRILAGEDPYTLRRNEALAPSICGEEVYGSEYAWALSGASIGVGFLRHVCPDQHTTRTFEIPACGSMLLADRTDEHAEFFQEGSEAEFFASPEELVDKARFYLGNDSALRRVAKQGYERCFTSGYSYHHRVAEVLAQLT
jgi:spore maturation protein CgeB